MRRLMRRREFVTLLSGAAAWPIVPLAAHAQQQPAMPVIGLLGAATAAGWAPFVAAFQQGLSQAGYVVGQRRHRVALGGWAYDRLPALAAELVRRQVTVIAAIGGNASALAAKAATTTIPIVFFSGVDPVQAGLVAGLNRPGGNITGVTSLGVELGPKRLELLHELLPAARVIAAISNPTNPSTKNQIGLIQAAADKLDLRLHLLHASNEREIDVAFATSAQLKTDALVIAPDNYLNSLTELLAALALRHAMPTIYTYREFAAAGGLMAYGASNMDASRLVGVYAGRILKGEKPADLPVQQSTKVELIINLKTAKALGHHSPAVAARPRRRGDRMKLQLGRREFIALLGGAAAWPLVARAQQPAMPILGFLMARRRTHSAMPCRHFGRV
jgi:putative ABC transport system substrate-binding protein